MFSSELSAAAATSERAVTAQPEQTEGDYIVTFWRTPSGLPHDTVNAILQTQDGYLWVGTAAGLARFDGMEFERIGREYSPALEDTTITALLEDKEGNLWVGTQQKGVFRLREGSAHRFTAAEGLASDNVTSLALGSNGVVWIGTQEGLNYWAGGSLGRFDSPAVPRNDGIVALHAGGSGALWITTRAGVFSLRDGKATAFKSDQLPQGRNAEFIGAYEDRSGNLWAFGATFLLNVSQGLSLNNFASFNLSSSRVWTICEQSNANFWIGTSGQGLFRFQNGRFEVVGAREGLQQSEIRALHADKWGNLWIGTGGKGLAKLRTRRVKVVGANAGVHSQSLASIAPDGKGGLWVGSADSGLWHWDGRQAEPWAGGGFLSRITQVQSLCLDARTNLWVGTMASGLIKMAGSQQMRLTTADGLADDAILCLAAEKETGVLWAGTRAGVVHRISDGTLESFGQAEGLPGTPVLCLLAEEKGVVLAGFENGGVARWNGKTFSGLPVPSPVESRPVRCLYKDSQGRLWIGTWGAGAFCRRNESWARLTRRQGLNSDNIGTITESSRGIFWFGTSENLFKAPGAEIDGFVNGTRDNIAFSPAVASNEGLRIAKGWPNTVSTGKGATWLACSAELLPLGETESLGSEPAPPVILERIVVNGIPRPPFPRGKLKLGPGTRSLDFEFTAINFSSPERVKLRHKMENFDADWVESDVGRRAHYGPLPAGEYRFHVIAANGEGVWNEMGASLQLIITPPFWRSWWFITLFILTAIAFIWAMARFISTRRLQARLRAAEQSHAMERERARIAQDMHDEIGSKLTRISFLSEIARQSGSQKNPASVQVEAIASTSRDLLQSLDEIVWAVNPRNDNLEHLAGYLEQYAREYFQGTPLECTIQVPPELPVVPLSAELRHNVFLAFEESLNNCMKHAHAKNVKITMSLQGSEFEVCLADDGQGFDTSRSAAPEDYGLQNIQQRLSKVEGSCTIQSKAGAGTTITMRFPLRKTERPVSLISSLTDS